MRIYSLPLLASLMIYSGLCAQQTLVDSIVAKKMKEWHIPGLAVAVLKQGHVIKVATYGTGNMETNTALTGRSVFITASLSKQFIATAIVLLEREGKLSIRDRAAKYVDSLPASWQQITIEQLLSHTSGLVRDPLDYQPYMPQTNMRVVRALFNTPLHAAPGEQFLYSNVGYFLLAEIITRAGGKPWERFLQERIFSPAGMSQTRIISSAAVVPGRVSGYHWSDTAWVNAENWLAIRPSGSVASTIEDMAKWEQYLCSGDILTEKERARMWTPAVFTSGSRSEYAYGWAVDSFLTYARIHHDGQYPGFRADYERFPAKDLAVIVLANADNVSVEPLALAIAGAYAPELKFPAFNLQLAAQLVKASVNQTVEIPFTLSNDRQPSPGTVIELEIWDAKGHSVYKENRQNENFAPSDHKTFIFHWTPSLKGDYSINIGIYGPHWSREYSWNKYAGNIIVE